MNPANTDKSALQHRYYVGPTEPALDAVDIDVLCATCRNRHQRGLIARIEDFCRRCWEVVAPDVIEESDALVPFWAMDD